MGETKINTGAERMKKFFIAIGVIVLLIPIVLSVVLYQQVLKEESLRERLLSVDVVNPDGITYTYQPDTENGSGAEIFSFLESLKGQLDKSIKTEDELTDAKKFALTYRTNHRDYTVTAYVLATDPNLFYTYLSNGKGDLYCLDANATNTFISRPFAYPVYDHTTLPVLKLTSGDVRTYSAKWNVKGPSADVLNVDFTLDVGNPTVISDYKGGEVLNFSVSPDSVTVKVRNSADNSEIFSGDGSLYPGFTFNRTATITIEINATWNKKDTSAFYGSATYFCVASIVAPPEYHLNVNTAKPGDVALLSALNIPKDAILSATLESSVLMESTEDEPSTPVFSMPINTYRSGDNVYAFVPFSYDFEAGEYFVVLRYGEEIQKLPVTVEKKTFSKAASVPSRLISADSVLAATSEEAMTAYRDLLAQIGISESSATLSFGGRFTDYQTKFNLYKGYGLYIPFESGNVTVRNDGVYFSAKKGSTMEAMGAGTVCYVGELAHIGKFVVIDHGYGLRTWYMTLGEVSVAVGDTLSAGDTVGKSGETGLCPSATMRVMITVDSTPVSPYAFWESDMVFVK